MESTSISILGLTHIQFETPCIEHTVSPWHHNGKSNTKWLLKELKNRDNVYQCVLFFNFRCFAQTESETVSHIKRHFRTNETKQYQIRKSSHCPITLHQTNIYPFLPSLISCCVFWLSNSSFFTHEISCATQKKKCRNYFQEKKKKEMPCYSGQCVCLTTWHCNEVEVKIVLFGKSCVRKVFTLSESHTYNHTQTHMHISRSCCMRFSGIHEHDLLLKHILHNSKCLQSCADWHAILAQKKIPHFSFSELTIYSSSFFFFLFAAVNSYQVILSILLRKQTVWRILHILIIV